MVAAKPPVPRNRIIQYDHFGFVHNIRHESVDPFIHGILCRINSIDPVSNNTNWLIDGINLLIDGMNLLINNFTELISGLGRRADPDRAPHPPISRIIPVFDRLMPLINRLMLVNNR